MSPTQLDGLTVYGPMGIVLSVFLALFVWAARLVLKRLLGHFSTVEGIMRDTAKAIAGLLEEMKRGRESAVRELREEIRACSEKESKAMKRRRR